DKIKQMDINEEKNLSNCRELPMSIPMGKANPQPMIIAITALKALAAKWCQNSDVTKAVRNA
ncbi:MAG: hypothetical protein QM498_14390, partial [Desulfobacterium sp.]